MGVEAWVPFILDSFIKEILILLGESHLRRYTSWRLEGVLCWFYYQINAITSLKLLCFFLIFSLKNWLWFKEILRCSFFRKTNYWRYYYLTTIHFIRLPLSVYFLLLRLYIQSVTFTFFLFFFRSHLNYFVLKIFT